MHARAMLVPSNSVSVLRAQNVFVPVAAATLDDIRCALTRGSIAARVEGVVTVADEPPHWWINVEPKQPLLMVDTIFA